MDIELLHTFLEVNRTRHFGKAANNLFLSQSTVSARINQLEETIGGPVFYRVRNDLQLTPIGRRLIAYAETILATWTRARQEVAIEEEIEELLVVGGVPTLWDISLNRWIVDIYEQYPTLALIGEVKNSESLLASLLSHTVDIAFLFECPQPRGIVIRELGPEPLVMVSSTKGLSAGRAVAENYIHVDWGTEFANSHAKLFPQLPMPRLRLEQGRLARDFILGHGGSCYLALSMVADDIRRKRLYEVEAPVIYRNSYALYHEASDKLQQIEKVLAVLPKKTPGTDPGEQI